MNTCSTRTQTLIGLCLMAVMLATRFHHFGDTLHLPDASWAIFFIAGFYLTPVWLLGMIATAVGIDVASVGWMGVSGYCLTPAYAAMLPAYAVLWFGGRWMARRASNDFAGLVKLSGVAVLSTLTAFVISNGAFYWFGGRVAETSLAQFGQTFVDYAPSFLASTLIYLAVAAAIHAVVLARPSQARHA